MKKIFLFVLLLTNLLSYAAQSLAQEATSPKQSVPPVMYGFLAHILDLQPYLYSRDAFIADQNQKFISEKLQEFTELSQQLKKHDRLQTPGFKVPASIIIKQLQDVNDAYLQVIEISLGDH